MIFPFRPDMTAIVPQGGFLPRLDQFGIFELSSTGLVENLENETTADYGVNPCAWHALPVRSIILWKVRHPVSQNGASLPVTVVIPSGGRSTLSNATGTAKVPVIDNKGTQVEGRDVTVPTGSGGGGEQQQLGNTTEHLVYVDKAAGIFRMLGVTAQNSPARAAEQNTPTATATKAAAAK